MKVALVKMLCRFVANWSDSTSPSLPTETPNPVTPNLDTTRHHYRVIGTTPGSAQEKRKGGPNRSKLSKSEIGTPSNFQHIGHVAWDPETAFDMDLLEPDLMVLLRESTMKRKRLKGVGNVQLTYNVVDQKGGIEAVGTEMEQRVASGFNCARAVAPPPSNDEELLPHEAGTGPAHPSAQTRRGQRASPSPGQPTPRGAEALLPPSPEFGGLSPLTNVFSAPVASPPPPPVFDSVASPPPNLRNNFLPEDDRRGAGLNPVETGKSLGAASSRYLLLDQIRHGCNLKSIADSPVSRPIPPAEADDIVGALIKVMQKRNRVIHSSTDFEDDDEWDD
ncbi:neural Wiskott-Aldrich syndrome protein-like isoform X2 [Scyliorhinus canicula]|uniref:neural Wiskott-Aldrich syndrome protein-like isoform X2 n=1 Tax=Scyliorhinus canicula TaxID=7830 RepID=UPI0018F5A2A3|nr:neural Wiskott-Aldrich syndrome protein-like isoform X2 [Scyliorhinus canicula]